MDFFLNMSLLNLQMAAMYGVLALGVYNLQHPGFP